MQRILVIRFSSFGDIVHTMAGIGPLKERFPESQIDFVVRAEFAGMVSCSPQVHQVWALRRDAGFKGLWRLALELRTRRYDRIYDAHRSLRSFLLRLMLRGPWQAFFPDWAQGPSFTSRSIERI